MDNLNIYNVEQGSEAWFDLRCGRITASKFKDAMSTKSTAGYKGLINNAVGEILSGTIEPTYTNDIMQRGIDLESEAAGVYEEHKDTPIDIIGFVTNNDIHPDYVGVSPDRIIQLDNGLVEIKCPLMKTHIGYLSSRTMPSMYKWQVQGQLLITGADYCDFMSYYPNLKPFIIRIQKDEQMQKELKTRLDESVIEIQTTLNRIK